jgi:hypothetical protein
MEVLNTVFSSGLIGNDGHEIAARLEKGHHVADIVGDIAVEFGRPDAVVDVQNVVRAWDSLHMEAVTRLVGWALGKLDTEDRLLIEWKGDAECHETVTKFELRDHTLRIEFAHPPVAASQVAAVGGGG